jgi:mRNA-degrading endonuclease RelE of RelBE toxin-antitoxin system
MTPWKIEFTAEAKKDKAKLDHAQRLQVDKAIYKARADDEVYAVAAKRSETTDQK